MLLIAFIDLLERRDIRGDRQGFTVQVKLHDASSITSSAV